MINKINFAFFGFSLVFLLCFVSFLVKKRPQNSKKTMKIPEKFKLILMIHTVLHCYFIKHAENHRLTTSNIILALCQISTSMVKIPSLWTQINFFLYRLCTPPTKKSGYIYIYICGSFWEMHLNMGKISGWLVSSRIFHYIGWYLVSGYPKSSIWLIGINICMGNTQK